MRKLARGPKSRSQRARTKSPMPPIDRLDDPKFWQQFATPLADCPFLGPEIVERAAVKAGVDPRRAIGKIAAHCHRGPVSWQ
jgi:hypothetical protein